MSKKRKMRNPRREKKIRKEQVEEVGDVCLMCLLKEDWNTWANVMRAKYGESVDWWETDAGELVIKMKDVRC